MRYKKKQIANINHYQKLFSLTLSRENIIFSL